MPAVEALLPVTAVGKLDSWPRLGSAGIEQKQNHTHLFSSCALDPDLLICLLLAPRTLLRLMGSLGANRTNISYVEFARMPASLARLAELVFCLSCAALNFAKSTTLRGRQVQHQV